MKKTWLVAARKAGQFAMFLLAGRWLAIGWIRCPFAVPYVMCAACPVTNCPGRWLQVWFLGLLVISQLLGRRLFCGWVCPMGLLQEFLGGRLLRRLLRRVAPAGSLSPARVVKFLLLAVVVIVFFACDWTKDYRPYDYVVRSPRTLSFDAPIVAMQIGLRRYAVRLGLAALALVGAVFVGRFWCRHLCPLGALLALTRTPSALKIHIDENACTHCHRCVRACPMRTLPNTGECISCLECWTVCPTDTIRLRPSHSAKIVHHVVTE